MYIQSLQLQSVRNLSNVKIDGSTGINYLYGANGAGKTSVLEGIYILSRGRSFRAGRGQDWICKQESKALLAAELIPDTVSGVKTDQPIRLGLEREKTTWRARLAGKDIKSQSKLAQALPVCLFEPETHQIILGSPELRRRFIDWSVFHVEHSYLFHWRRYQRALKQRNQALRDKTELSVINSITASMLDSAMHVNQQRMVFFERLQEAMTALLPVFNAESLSIKLSLQPGWDTTYGLEASWKKDIENDINRGYTNSGPQRADIRILADSRLARHWLSRGQQKLVALLLVLAQQQVLSTKEHQQPILLLDDLQSEFDQERYEQLFTFLATLDNQVWLTGVNPPGNNNLCQKLFHVKQGVINTV